MSESNSVEINGGRLQDFTIDQAAGAIALSLGALGSLLLVIWQSRCLCRCRIHVGISDQCYLFDCTSVAGTGSGRSRRGEGGS
jgi:hypothetical protein